MLSVSRGLKSVSWDPELTSFSQAQHEPSNQQPLIVLYGAYAGGDLVRVRGRVVKSMMGWLTVPHAITRQPIQRDGRRNFSITFAGTSNKQYVMKKSLYPSAQKRKKSNSKVKYIQLQPNCTECLSAKGPPPALRPLRFPDSSLRTNDQWLNVSRWTSIRLAASICIVLLVRQLFTYGLRMQAGRERTTPAAASSQSCARPWRSRHRRIGHPFPPRLLLHVHGAICFAVFRQSIAHGSCRHWPCR